MRRRDAIFSLLAVVALPPWLRVLKALDASVPEAPPPRASGPRPRIAPPEASVIRRG